jgi:hypothetical protein
MVKIDALTSVASPKGPMLHDDERLWVQFQKFFRDCSHGYESYDQATRRGIRLWNESVSNRKIV